MHAVFGAKTINGVIHFAVTVYSKTGEVMFADTSKSPYTEKSKKSTLSSALWAIKRLNAFISEKVEELDECRMSLYLSKSIYKWLTETTVTPTIEVEDILYELSYLTVQTRIVMLKKPLYIVRFERKGLEQFEKKYTRAKLAFQ